MMSIIWSEDLRYHGCYRARKYGVQWRSSVVLMCLFILLDVATASCPPTTRCHKEGETFKVAHSAAYNSSFHASTRDSVCRSVTNLFHCTLPVFRACSNVNQMHIHVRRFMRFNYVPYRCMIHYRQNEPLQKCMPSMLNECHGEYMSTIGDKIKHDETAGDPHYNSTCRSVIDFRHCYEKSGKYCDKNTLARLETIILPYFNYKTYDCFPGEKEPYGMCRNREQYFRCKHRYGIPMVRAMNHEKRKGYEHACKVVQAYYDCVIIRSSGCPAQEIKKDLDYMQNIINYSNCTIDKCTKLWTSCKNKYMPILHTGRMTCKDVVDYINCLKPLTPFCRTNVTAALEMLASIYRNHCRALKNSQIVGVTSPNNHNSNKINHNAGQESKNKETLTNAQLIASIKSVFNLLSLRKQTDNMGTNINTNRKSSSKSVGTNDWTQDTAWLKELSAKQSRHREIHNRNRNRNKNRNRNRDRNRDRTRDRNRDINRDRNLDRNRNINRNRNRNNFRTQNENGGTISNNQANRFTANDIAMIAKMINAGGSSNSIGPTNTNNNNNNINNNNNFAPNNNINNNNNNFDNPNNNLNEIVLDEPLGSPGVPIVIDAAESPSASSVNHMVAVMFTTFLSVVLFYVMKI